jgi:hypothetical protein
MKKPQPGSQLRPRRKVWEDRFQKLAKALEFKVETQIEIRFKSLDYGLVWMLQADELVNRTLTSQSKASIRIVLETISSMQADQESD